MNKTPLGPTSLHALLERRLLSRFDASVQVSSQMEGRSCCWRGVPSVNSDALRLDWRAGAPGDWGLPRAELGLSLAVRGQEGAPGVHADSCVAGQPPAQKPCWPARLARPGQGWNKAASGDSRTPQTQPKLMTVRLALGENTG